MSSEVESGLAKFQWETQPQAAELVAGVVDDFCHRSSRLDEFRRRLRERTGTRIVDWIDHLVIPADDPAAARLSQVGFLRQDDAQDQYETWQHQDGLFPRFRVGGQLREMDIKVDSIDDFLASLGRTLGETLPFKWPAPGPYRKVPAFSEGGVQLGAVERSGTTAFCCPKVTTEQLQAVEEHLAVFRVRGRKLDDPHDGFAEARERFAAAAEDLGTGWACDLFFRAEREYWQSRNHAARVQYRRQQRLGLGWANHDHHTYRSSRSMFLPLIETLERMGFECRERFYAGREAGWGAQVLEQTDCGVVVFADVDLSPEEVTGDFAHQKLPERDELGTVGLWCALHGEAFLAAGMHHLECQFDFDAIGEQLAAEGVPTMAPFTDFPYLKQAFTTGEVWKVDPARIDALREDGAISNQQAEKFRSDGALGSHLEILERNDGYKGFNQTGINDIILRTDPRN